MLFRPLKVSAAVLLAGAALLTSIFAIPGQARDLTQLERGRLAKDIDAELRPIYARGNTLDDLDYLFDVILDALTDDDHNGDEDTITGEELRQAINKVHRGLTLEDVIWHALEEADLEAFLWEQRAPSTVRLEDADNSRLLQLRDPAGHMIQVRSADKKTTDRAAAMKTREGIVKNITP
jgi:hypothetical protein